MGLTTNTRSNSGSVVNLAMGNVVTDGGAAAATTFNCGFVPRYIKWVNTTAGGLGVAEWFDGMPSAIATAVAVNTVAAGTRTLTAAGSGIAVGTPALLSAGQFTVPAALIPASSTFAWMAMG
jgi:hypothetical protein